jgi:hypothetical protein
MELMAVVFVWGMVALQLTHLVMEAMYGKICHCVSYVQSPFIIAAMARTISGSLSSIFVIINVFTGLVCGSSCSYHLWFYAYLYFGVVCLFIYLLFLLSLLLAPFLGARLYRKVEGMFLQNGDIHQQDYMTSQRGDNDLNIHCHEKFKT